MGERYALALYELCEEQNIDIFSTLEMINDVFADKQILNIFASPLISFDEKKSIIEKLSIIDEVLNNFMFLLIQKGRIIHFDEIFKEFKSMYYKKHNMLYITINSAMRIDDETLDMLIEKLTVKYNKKIMYTINIDKNLIGGISISVEDKLIDGSIKSRLEKLEQILV